SRGDQLAEVRGKVLIGDQPPPPGMGFVIFHPDAAKGNKWMEEASGPIQADGSYVLADPRGKSGAAPGWYKVAVSYAKVMNPNNPYVTDWLIPQPEKYSYWDKSGIEIEVVEKPQAGQYDIKLPPVGAKPSG